MESEQKSGEFGPLSGGKMKNETILVVDDNRQLGNFIAETLLPSMGYESTQVYNGASALKSIHHQKPSLLLLDLELPDINGLDLLRRLHQDGITIPTILFTAHGSEQVAIDAFRLGVQDYLIKPVDADQLVGAIGHALEETRLRGEKASLLDELNDQVNQLTTLSKIGQSVTSTLDLDEVLRRIVEAGVHLTQADEGFLALLDHSSGTLYLRASKNIDGEITSSLRLPIADSLLGEALTTNRPTRKIAQQAGSPIKIGTGLLVKSLLNVPISSRGRPLGVLSVDNREKQSSFSEKDEILLASLADYAAVALENAHLYQQARREINERLRAETALRESEERYALAARGANDGIWDLNLGANAIYLSPRWKEMLGYQDHEIGDSPDEWFSRIYPDDLDLLKTTLSALVNGKTPHLEAECRVRHKDGSYRWMLTRGVAVHGPDNSVDRIAGSQTDISERKMVEARLVHDAFHDKLTGLPNRALFLDRLEKAIWRAQQEPEYSFAVLFLDLDQFKDINDSLGHPTGDQLLVAVARILKNTLRLSDTVARQGGDEFVILLDGIRDGADAILKSREIQAAVAAPITLGHHNIFISTSIGIVLGELGYSQAEDILRDADIAMYGAKRRGKSTFEMFDPQMRQSIMERLSLENDLKSALSKNQLQVHYQPIVALQDGKLTGFEALVHWQHPRNGLLTAGQFLAIAQETGLILPIDWWVFEEACSQILAWQKDFPIEPALKASINLSSTILLQADLIGSMQKSLAKTGFAPQNLVLEITENIISQNIDLLGQTISKLKAAGIGVEIDDFGKGYSTLLYLKSLSIDALKIDRAFVRMITEGGREDEIPRMIINLAHGLGINTIAEGIETAYQLSCLREMGCDYGQGYFFCSPLSEKDAGKLLEKAQHTNQLALPWSRHWRK
jgi:diguanylate cyclase (GGDEF)-like protein/PAS domain S-box-containing protein